MVTDLEEAKAADATGAPADERLLYELLDLGFALVDRNNKLIADLLRELELTKAVAEALWKLDPGEAAPTMREMAGRLGCDPSNVTLLADRLQERGLAERRVNPANRRSTSLVLTPGGARVRRRLVETMATRSPLAELSLAEQHELHRLLSKATSTTTEGDGEDCLG